MKRKMLLFRKRTRLKLIDDIIPPRRSCDYLRLRWFWLNELYYLRAKRRAGTGSLKDIKTAQRELARIRKEG